MNWPKAHFYVDKSTTKRQMYLYLNIRNIDWIRNKAVQYVEERLIFTFIPDTQRAAPRKGRSLQI